MKTLQEMNEKLAKMINGEKKRREVAITFLEKTTTFLSPICQEYFSKIEGTEAIFLTNLDEKMEKYKTDVYFRYSTHYGDNNVSEPPGFYDSYSGDLFWETPIDSMKGTRFWINISTILGGIEFLFENLKKKENIRTEVAQKIEKLSAII